IDNALLSLGTASLEVTDLYAELVDDERVRTTILERIRAEYVRACRWLLAVVEQCSLLDASPVLQRSVALRNPYVDPLHVAQVALLRRWRGTCSHEQGTAGAEDTRCQELLRGILHTINGIAAGVQVSG